MFKQLTNFLTGPTVRRYVRKVGKQLFSTIRRDAAKALRQQLLTMKFEDFRASRVFVDGEDVIDDTIFGCFTYLGRYVVDVDSEGNLSINIGGFELYETSLYRLEQKLFGLLSGSK